MVWYRTVGRSSLTARGGKPPSRVVSEIQLDSAPCSCREERSRRSVNCYTGLSFPLFLSTLPLLHRNLSARVVSNEVGLQVPDMT